MLLAGIPLAVFGIIPGLAQHRIGDIVLAGAVALYDGPDEVLGHVGVVREQLLRILRQTIPSVSEGGVVIMRADARVEADPFNNGLRVESLDFGGDSYVILLASDSYDVPFKGGDDEIFDEGASDIFDYILCCVCPVKDAKSSLRYFAEEHNFRSSSTGHVLGAPELGFMFPAFDDRSANIYNALYYSRALSDVHEDFIAGVFNTAQVPMSAGAQKNTFSDVLCESLGKDCNLDVVKAVHRELRERLQLHRESNNPEIPEIEIEDVDDILENNGVPAEKVKAFNEACRTKFGDSASLNPITVMETKKFEMTTPEVKITIDPEYTSLIETKLIDGRTYLVIPAEGEITVNGIEITAAPEHP